MALMSTDADLDRYKLPDDPAAVLEALGFVRVKEKRNGKIVACCLLHGGDNPEGFVVYPDKGIYACGTAKCWKGDLISLVEEVEGLDFKGAVAWLGRFLGIAQDDDWQPQRPRRRLQEVPVKPATVERPKAPPRVTPETIAQAEAAYWQHGNYWARRARPFREETLRLYQAGLVRRREGNREVGFVELTRAIFPVYSAAGELVGWTGRVTDDSLINDKDRTRAIVPKWRHHPGPYYDPTDRKTILAPGFESRDHFFGWQQAEWCLLEEPVAILAEGPGDVLSGAELACELGEPWFPLGLFGTALKEQQAEILQANGIAEVWLVIDQDEINPKTGKRAGDHMIESVRRLLPTVDIWIVRLPEGIKDLGELQDAETYRRIIEARERVF